MAYNTLENKIHSVYWKALGRKATNDELENEKAFVTNGNPQPDIQFKRLNEMASRIAGTTLASQRSKKSQLDQALQ